MRHVNVAQSLFPKSTSACWINSLKFSQNRALDTLFPPNDMVWYSWWQQISPDLDACIPIEITGGQFYQLDGAVYEPLRSDSGSSLFLLPDCVEGNPVLYVNIPVVDHCPKFLYQATENWYEWAVKGTDSIVHSTSLLISIVSISATFKLALIIVMLMSYREVPLIVRVASYYTFALSLVIFGTMTRVLRSEFIAHRQSIIGPTQYTWGITVASFVSFSLLILAQVRVTMDLFERRLERKMALFAGLLLGIVTTVVTGIARLKLTEDIPLILLSYLLQLALYIIFVGCVVLRCVSAGPVVFSRNLAAMTTLTIVLACGPASLFIADISGWWLGRYVNDLLHTMNFLATNMTFFWTRSLADMKEREMAERPIGRRVFEAAPKLPTETNETEIELQPLAKPRLDLRPKALKSSISRLRPK